MSETMPKKSEVIAEFKTHDGDTGSPEVQIALLTKRIAHLTEHLKTHKKDNTPRRGLLKLVGTRSKLLRYLWRKDPNRHDTVVASLGIRSHARK